MCFASFIHDVEDTARARKRINVGRNKSDSKPTDVDTTYNDQGIAHILFPFSRVRVLLEGRVINGSRS